MSFASPQPTNALVEDVTPDGANDLVRMWDASATAEKRVLLQKLLVEVAAVAPPTFVGREWLDTEATGSPGSGLLTVHTFTSSDSLTSSHCVTLWDATSGAIVVTLPPIGSSAGRLYYIKKIDPSVNIVTIDGNGTDIDGVPTRQLTSQYADLTIVGFSPEWWIL